MSNFSVNYLPSSNAILGLQNSGVLTVFDTTTSSTIVGPTGITGSVGNIGPAGSSTPISSTGITGAILYSNGSGGIGATGGLLWNLGSQTLTTNTILSNTVTLGNNGNIYPISDPVTITVSSAVSITANVQNNILTTTISTPNFGNTWSFYCTWGVTTGTLGNFAYIQLIGNGGINTLVAYGFSANPSNAMNYSITGNGNSINLPSNQNFTLNFFVFPSTSGTMRPNGQSSTYGSLTPYISYRWISTS